MTSRGAVGRYVAGLAAPALAAVLLALVWRQTPAPQLLFYPAVFVAARIGGVGPGLVASFGGTLLMNVAFIPPYGSLAVSTAEDALDLGIFLVVSVGMSINVGHTVRQLRDALERERAAALEAKRAKEATDATWEIVAHDLRTPLSAITLGSENLEGDLDADSVGRQTLGVIQHASETAARLIRDAVDAMGFANGELKVVLTPCATRQPLEAVVKVASPLARKARVELVLEAPPDGRVMCDASRLLQVVLNLVVNAIRFTPPGGRVTVTATDDAGHVVIAVRDTGPGVAPERQAAIFSKYWTSGSGAGLGLWIAKTLVEAHGGALALVSREGQGAEFSFTLRRADPP